MLGPASAPLLALFASLSFAIARIFLRPGLAHSTPLTATLISVTVTGVFITGLAATTASLSLLFSRQVWPFLLAGLAAPGAARLVLFVGIHRIGVARSSALSAMAPLFSIFLAVMFLGERPTAMLVFGAACVVAGTVLLAHQGAADHQWRRRDMIFPILAGCGFAVRDTISRYGLQTFPQPIVASLVAILTSLVVIWLAASCQQGKGTLRFQRAGTIFIVISGFCEGMAYIALWRALATGHVSVISPLIYSQAFFSVILTAIFLRKFERVTWRIFVGCVLIVVGVVLVISFGGA